MAHRGTRVYELPEGALGTMNVQRWGDWESVRAVLGLATKFEQGERAAMNVCAHDYSGDLRTTFFTEGKRKMWEEVIEPWMGSVSHEELAARMRDTACESACAR